MQRHVYNVALTSMQRHVYNVALMRRCINVKCPLVKKHSSQKPVMAAPLEVSAEGRTIYTPYHPGDHDSWQDP